MAPQRHQLRSQLTALLVTVAQYPLPISHSSTRGKLSTPTSTMDALKSATNFGTTTTSQQSGQEPVSGEEGAGTATQPFDQGNAEGESLVKQN